MTAVTTVKEKKIAPILKEEWVFNQDGQVLTDSLTVGLVFDKEHKTVLRDIRNLLKTTEEAFGQYNFVLSTYTSAQNKQVPKYLLTEDGFTLLVMGYTGKLATKYKVEYIKRFRALKEELQQKLPGAVQEYLTLSENERAIKFFEQRMTLDNHKKELKKAKPKVEFHDRYVKAEGLQTSAQVAKTLGTGRNRLLKWMRAEGILQGDNSPYQKYMNKGYFVLKQHLDKNKNKTSEFTIQFTSKGIAWVAKKYIEAGCPAN